MGCEHFGEMNMVVGVWTMHEGYQYMQTHMSLPSTMSQVSSINQENIWKFKHIMGNMEVALEILKLKLIGWWEDKCYLWLIFKTQYRK